MEESEGKRIYIVTTKVEEKDFVRRGKFLIKNSGTKAKRLSATIFIQQFQSPCRNSNRYHSHQCGSVCIFRYGRAYQSIF